MIGIKIKQTGKNNIKKTNWWDKQFWDTSHVLLQTLVQRNI